MSTNVIDPVCKMTVDPASAPSAEANGMTYYFCAEGCRRAFVKDPAAYLGGAHEANHDHGAGHHH